jgi:hypothetical protein
VAAQAYIAGMKPAPEAEKPVKAPSATKSEKSPDLSTALEWGIPAGTTKAARRKMNDSAVALLGEKTDEQDGVEDVLAQARTHRAPNGFPGKGIAFQPLQHGRTLIPRQVDRLNRGRTCPNRCPTSMLSIDLTRWRASRR